MNTIWKFVLNPDDLKLKMPQGAKILTAREQRDSICIWAEVDSSASIEERNFEVFGTGHKIPKGPEINRTYLGTAMLEGGSLVFHIYERLSDKKTH